MAVNRHHKEIIRLYSSYSGKFSSKHGNSYIGTTKFSYPINTPSSRKLLKDWLGFATLTPSTYRDLLNSLSQGKSHHEFSAIGKLLEFCPKLRKTLDPNLLNNWLNHAEGWAEVDTICQGNFTAEEILGNWLTWQKLIKNLAVNKNPHKQRASLVLLTGPVRHSSDCRLSKTSFENIDKLKHDRNILITKAISWLLRDLIAHHRKEVETYLKRNAADLPAIAAKETINKLRTGRKSGR